MIKDFIGIFDNTLSKDMCDKIIGIYDQSEKLNYTRSRKDLGENKIKKDNNLVFANSRKYIDNDIHFKSFEPYIKEFVDTAWICYREYANKYGMLNNVASHRFYDSIKIQKTKPTEGYHLWHCEHDTRETGSRLLLVMLYLNDVKDGGETEFLYQSKRIEPKQGRLVICPASFTHTHRGNPPLKTDKYMINGWIEFDK